MLTKHTKLCCIIDLHVSINLSVLYHNVDDTRTQQLATSGSVQQ